MNKPHFIGSFVQPSLVDKWSEKDWERHYDLLLEAGIDVMILQWIAETPDGKFTYIGYESENASFDYAENCRKAENYLPNALEAAQKKGVKVFIGLNFADEWWGGGFRNAEWVKKQTDINNAMAKEIYDRYKPQYPSAFYGWYWVWEMYNDTNGDEVYWADMMNRSLAFFTQLDKSLPVLMSPFISGYLDKTPEETGTMWRNFFEKCDFRPGDIFCSQDSVGASQFPIEKIEKHVAAMKKAASVKPEVKFWINVESFSGKAGEGPAPLDRVIKQMEMASKYSDELITFSYSHYYLNKLEPNEYHKQYLEYLKR